MRDAEVVQAFRSDLAVLASLTPRQRDWQRVRWMVERDELSSAQIDVLCAGCGNPYCVVHGTMPPRLRPVLAPEGADLG